MKKYSLIIVTVFSLLNCSDFLEEDPKGRLAQDDFFSSKADLDLAITALFSRFQNVVSRTGRGIYMYCADDVTSQNAGNKTRFAEYDMFNFNSGNTEVAALYSGLWSAVKAANYIINNAERTPADEAFINARLGQAYFIRAYCYFNLVRLWGKVPIITDLTIDYKRKREEVADVYALIEADCEIAEAMLPVTHTLTPYFRYGLNLSPTKGAAKALLASVYMTEAGWPLERGAAYYDLAAAKYKEIIDNEVTYGYILETDIKNLASEPTANFSKEIVFGAFFNKDGNAASSNDFFSTPYSELPEETNGFCDMIVELEFFNSMPAGPRKDAWILTEISILSKKDPVTDMAPWVVPWDSPETNQRHPHWKKNIDNGNWNYSVDPVTSKVFYTNGGLTTRSSKTKFIFRYADILLLYAEAKSFGTDGPDDLAYTSLNRVRDRAGLSTFLVGDLSTEEFQQTVLDERRWETCGMELSCMSRFFTMQRHKILHLQGDYRDPDDLPLNPALSLSEAFYYFPIPDMELLIVPDFN